MNKKFMFSLILLIGALITTGCSQSSSSPNDSVVDSTSSSPHTEEPTNSESFTEEVALYYYDVAEMKVLSTPLQLENPSPEKLLKLLTQALPETGSLNRLPSEMSIDAVKINPETKTAEAFATLDESLIGNYSSSAWSESIAYSIVYTLIENTSFGIEKVILGENFAGLYGLSGSVCYEIVNGELVTTAIQQ